MPEAARFWAKVDRSGGPDACWPWTAALQRGYGLFMRYPEGRKKFNATAHRVAYELATGEAPGELQVLHRCDNPPCVNPKHLYLGDRAQNMRDKVERGRANQLGARRNRTTQEQRQAMADAVASGQSVRATARAFGVEVSVVRRWRDRLSGTA